MERPNISPGMIYFLKVIPEETFDEKSNGEMNLTLTMIFMVT